MGGDEAIGPQKGLKGARAHFCDDISPYSWQNYKEVFNCKVQISTNLHEMHVFYRYGMQKGRFHTSVISMEASSE